MVDVFQAYIDKLAAKLELEEKEQEDAEKAIANYGYEDKRKAYIMHNKYLMEECGDGVDAWPPSTGQTHQLKTLRERAKKLQARQWETKAAEQQIEELEAIRTAAKPLVAAAYKHLLYEQGEGT